MNIKDIAKTCHQVNKAYCESIGDSSQVDWANAPSWQKESAINGVNFHINRLNSKASASHESWMKEKIETGWVYGTVKSSEFKTHPCIIPFEELPKEQQAKDFIFKAIVDALKPHLTTL